MDKNPVLLIHGLDDTAAVFHRMAPYLSDRGWSVYDISLIPSNATVGIDLLAEQLRDYIDQTFSPDQPFDLLGFSMGGIVSRYYIQRLGGIKRVGRFISLASPNNGTFTAYWYNRPGCIQMRPNSRFLRDLNQDAEMLAALNFTCIWTPFDLMILPADSSRMPIGKQVRLPVLTHPQMLTETASLEAVVAALSEPLKLRDRQFQPTPDRQKSPLNERNT